jgi:hypothetical protein
MTRMALNKGQKVLVKKHNGGTLMGRVLSGRPKEEDMAEEDRLY